MPSATLVIQRPDGAPVVSIPAELDDSARPVEGARQWRATVSGLEPETTYCYEIQVDGVAAARAGFRTAPAPGLGRVVRFVALGDSGSGSGDQYAVLQQLNTVPIDLVLHVGDMGYDHGKRIELEWNFFRVYERLLEKLPVFPASGNHEYDTEDAAPFREMFALPENGGVAGRERWYSYDWGDVHFVVLDTEQTGPLQAAWLDADLAASTRRWKIVYGHRPPYSSGSHGSDQLFRQHFVPILEKHQVPLVLTGHDHHYERTHALNGVTYIVTGGGGKGTRQAGSSAFTAFREAVCHFVWGEIAGDTLTLHVIDGVGVEFDSLVIRR